MGNNNNNNTENEDKALLIGGVSISELTKILKSESVYWALRTAYKRPSSCGVDNCEDSDNIDLFNIVKELRQD